MSAPGIDDEDDLYTSDEEYGECVYFLVNVPEARSDNCESLSMWPSKPDFASLGDIRPPRDPNAKFQRVWSGDTAMDIPETSQRPVSVTGTTNVCRRLLSPLYSTMPYNPVVYKEEAFKDFPVFDPEMYSSDSSTPPPQDVQPNSSAVRSTTSPPARSTQHLIPPIASIEDEFRSARSPTKMPPEKRRSGTPSESPRVEHERTVGSSLKAPSFTKNVDWGPSVPFRAAHPSLSFRSTQSHASSSRSPLPHASASPHEPSYHNPDDDDEDDDDNDYSRPPPPYTLPRLIKRVHYADDSGGEPMRGITRSPPTTHPPAPRANHTPARGKGGLGASSSQLSALSLEDNSGDDDDESDAIPSSSASRPSSVRAGKKRAAVEQSTDDDYEMDDVPSSSTKKPSKSSAASKPRKTKRRKTLKPFLCPHDWCKETFTRKNDVKRHLLNAAVHRNDNPDRAEDDTKRCKRCQADLSRPDARARHERAGACGKRTTPKVEFKVAKEPRP